MIDRQITYTQVDRLHTHTHARAHTHTHTHKHTHTHTHKQTQTDHTRVDIPHKEFARLSYAENFTLKSQFKANYRCRS